MRLGTRRAPGTIAPPDDQSGDGELVHALNEPDSVLRGVAADALGKIGDPSTGQDLFRRYAIDDTWAMRTTLLLALRSTRYAPALPALIEALADADPGIRRFAAIGLADMGDKSALPALRRAYAEEPESRYACKESMRHAIDALERD
jgi:HEAT repeat protein